MEIPDIMKWNRKKLTRRPWRGVSQTTGAREKMPFTLRSSNDRMSWVRGISPRGESDGLSPRQYQIMQLIVKGRRNKQMAGELGLSYHTVSLHIHNIYKKLGVKNRAEAVKRWSWKKIQTSQAADAVSPLRRGRRASTREANRREEYGSLKARNGRSSFPTRTLKIHRTRSRQATNVALSQRQREIMKKICKGMVAQDVANVMGVSYCTVREHLERIYNKLGVKNRAEAVKKWMEEKFQARRMAVAASPSGTRQSFNYCPNCGLHIGAVGN